MQLKFNNGKFKILILADIQDTDTPQKATTSLLNAAINKTEPDFIVLLGDNTAGWWKGVNKEKTEAAVDAVAKAIDDKGIPFALVFGNHDHEGLANDENGVTEEEAKEFLLSCYQKYDTCMAVEGEEMTGVGNYNLLIKDSAGENDVFNLWFMDSNPYATEEEGGGYGYVHEDQTAWYKKTSNELKNSNGGKPMPSLLFQHIIVPEAYDMLTETEKSTKGAVSGSGVGSGKYYIANNEYIYQGNVNEGPCPPNSNHGQFDSWLEQGDIIGAFFGHDHVNDFAGEYKGIKLVASPAVGFYSYGNHHGIRTITLDENNLTDFQSDIILYDDIADYKLNNSYIKNHGYSEYKNKFLPAVIGAGAGAIIIGTIIGFSVTFIKKRKRKK
ncbi:MAG: metallophosphoesterase [Clostridiales bacterium]|nr:metallophosphoesterase [Clostridiales bacterium]